MSDDKLKVAERAVQALRTAKNSQVTAATAALNQAIADLGTANLSRGKAAAARDVRQVAQDLLAKRAGDATKKDAAK